MPPPFFQEPVESRATGKDLAQTGLSHEQVSVKPGIYLICSGLLGYERRRQNDKDMKRRRLSLQTHKIARY
jgi:hypothetical protein